MRRTAAILLLSLFGCGDKSPPALWPEPPPPALAEPIGVADPDAAKAAPSPPTSVGDPKVEAPPPKPAEAKQEQ